MIKSIIVIVGIVSLVILSGCVGNSLNSNPPDYIKSIVAVQEGPGLQIYYILADKGGAMTTADGSFVLEISQDDRTLWKSRSVNVTKSDFEQRSVGMGNFAHDVIMFLVGRIAYEDMYRMPESGLGDVKLTFTTTDGRVLEEEDTTYL